MPERGSCAARDDVCHTPRLCAVGGCVRPHRPEPRKLALEDAMLGVKPRLLTDEEWAAMDGSRGGGP